MQDIQRHIDKAWKHFVEMADTNDRTNAILDLLRMPSEPHSQEIRWILVALSAWLYPSLGNPREKRFIGGLAFFLYGIIAGKKISQGEFTCLLNQNSLMQQAFQRNQIQDWFSAIEILKQLAEKPCADTALDDEKKRISRQSLDAGYQSIQNLLLQELPKLSQDPEAYRKNTAPTQMYTLFEQPHDETRILYDLLSAVATIFLQALDAKLSRVLRLILHSFSFFSFAFVAYLIFFEVPLLGTIARYASLTYVGLTGFLVLWFCVQLLWIPTKWIDSRLFSMR